MTTNPPLLEATPPVRDTRRGWLMLAVFGVAEVTFLAMSLVVVLLFTLVSHPRVPGASLPPAVLVAALVVPTVLAGLVAMAGAALVGRGSLGARLRTQLSVRWWLGDVGIGLLLGVVGLIITVPASVLWSRWVGPDQAKSAVGEAFEDLRLPLGMALVLFVGVWLVAPLCEELLYRGVLWRALEHWRWNRWVIFVLTSLVFSLAHLELLRTPLLVVLSLPIALARMLTGNLLASIVAHQTNNFLPAIGLLLLTQGVVPS